MPLTLAQICLASRRLSLNRARCCALLLVTYAAKTGKPELVVLSLSTLLEANPTKAFGEFEEIS